MKLALVVAGKLPAGIDQKLLERAVEVVGEQVDGPNAKGINEGVINLKLVDAAEIEALNKNYSGQAKATDVLSFSYIENGSQPVEDELGDVAICLEIAQHQADAAKTDLQTEIALLLIHGTMHILGLDHAGDNDKQSMDEAQQQIMTVLGLNYRNFGWTS